MNIYQKINEIRKAVDYIQKDKQVQTYKAVSHDMVVAVVRKAFVKEGVITYPEQIGGVMNAQGVKASKDGNATVPDSMRLYEGKYIIHFVNIDDPLDRISVPIEAHANDNGDKAPGKAVTYATKAAILKVLMLETGENDESRMAGLDISDELDRLSAAKDLDTLKEILKELWHKHTTNEARKQITDTYNLRKAALMEPQE